MQVFRQLRIRAKSDPKVVVLPEIGKERNLHGPPVLERAMGVAQSQGLARAIGLSKESIEESGKIEEFAEQYCRLRGLDSGRLKGVMRLIRMPGVFGAMMVRLGYAHGMISGKYTSSFTVMAAVRAMIPAIEGYEPSSLFLIEPPHNYPVFPVMGIADVVVNTDPAPGQLAGIIATTCETFETLTGLTARAAVMSYSTGDSGSGPMVDKIRQAMDAYMRRKEKWMVFGPCQVDAAINPAVARNKKGCPFIDEPANVLIGPNLDVANTIYKAFRWLIPGCRSMLCSQGLSLPVDDLSRGDDVDDIVNVIAANVVKAQAIEKRGGVPFNDYFLTL